MSRRSISMPVALLAACCILPGCVGSYRLLKGPVPDVVGTGTVRAVRVTTRDSAQVMLYGAKLYGDTLIGWNDVESAARPGTRFLVRVAVSDIVKLEHPRMNWFASLGLGVLVLVVAGFVALAASGTGGGYGFD